MSTPPHSLFLQPILDRLDRLEVRLQQWRQSGDEELQEIRQELLKLMKRMERGEQAFPEKNLDQPPSLAIAPEVDTNRQSNEPMALSVPAPSIGNKAPKAARSGFLGCLMTLMTLMTLAAVIVALFFGRQTFEQLWEALPSREQIDITSRAMQLIINKEKNNIEEIAVVNTVHVPLEHMPVYLPQAFIAIEDQRFFQHGGLDPAGMLSSLGRALMQGKRLGGGSTISQQTVKNLFFNSSRSLYRKLKESILALKLEHYFSKNEILSMYLNNAYFGETIYGVEAAALNYFSKHASELNLMESALLAAMVKGPNYYHPQKHPDRSRLRARLVLSKMQEQGFISPEAMATALATGVILGKATWQPVQHHYLRDWIIPDLINRLGSRDGRFRVMTTLDPKIQHEARTALQTQLHKSRALQVEQGAILTLGKDGAVLAMQGGTDFTESQLNRCTQAVRSPGSALKTFLYLTALEHGMTRQTILEDAPVEIDEWTPNNFDNDYLGEISLEKAFILSRNTVAVLVLQQLGVETYLQRLRRLGLERSMPANYTLALGTGEMTVLELASLYATLANDGIKTQPYAIHGVIDMQGELLYWRQPSEIKRVVDPGPLKQIKELLAKVVKSGTGQKAALSHRTVYGKTGTSQGFRDAWFVGFTDDLTTAVWLGNDDNTPMDDITGGSLPAVIWKKYMQKVSSF
ncbi:MAG: PBP1A family penicillin-binding protein [Magnetococcales bacterium]|nr:PBP1A family penicillin-binding protein [Magnetococcales bacterium]